MDAPITPLNGSAGAEWKSKLLAGEASREQQVTEVAKEFEGILVRQFLDEAFKPMSKDGGFFGTKSSPMQEQMIKDTLARSITEAGSLGFTSVLQAQFQSKMGDGVEPKEETK